MPQLLRIAALVALVLAVLYGFGWLFATDSGKAIAFVALGLLLWILSTIPVPSPRV